MATRIIRGTQTVTDYNQAGETALVATLTASGTTLANNFQIYNTDIPAIRIWNGTAFQNLTQQTLDDIPTPYLVRTTPVRVATFGDSTASFYAPSTQDSSLISAPFPASGNTTQFNIITDRIALQVFYPVAYLVGSGGISGQTTTQMLARDALAGSTTRKAISDIIDLKPDVVLLRGGSINDLLGITSGTLAAAVTSTYNNHILIIQRFIAAGIPVIDSGLYGYSGGGATDIASTKSAILQLNILFATYAQSFPGRVFFINYTNLLSDNTGTYLSNVTSDGTHLSTQGEYISGRQEASIVTSLFGKSSSRRFLGTNLNTNSSMSVTSTSGIGTVATGLAIGGNGSITTIANAKVEIIDGRVWQTAEVTNTATGGFSNIYMPFTPTTFGIVAGDIFGVEFDFYAAALNGGPPPLPNSINGRLNIIKTGAGSILVDGLVPNVTAIAFNEAYTGHCSIGPVQIQEPSANLSASSNMYFTYATNQVTTFKIGVSMVRIVKLGTTDVPTSFLTSGSIPVAISSGGIKSGVLKDSGDTITLTPLSGATMQLQGVLYTQTTATTVANSVTETTILGAGLGYGRTLPTNFFNVIGKSLRLRIGGVYSTPIASTPTLIIKIKYGAVILATVTTTGLFANAVNERFDGDIVLTCTSLGTTGTVLIHGAVQYAVGMVGQVLADPLNNAGAAITINTTTANLLDVTVQWDTATTTRTATSTIALLEVLN